jgi:hypothetical protein
MEDSVTLINRKSTTRPHSKRTRKERISSDLSDASLAAPEKEVKLNKKVAQALCKLPNTYAEKRQAGPGRKGQLDITGCSHGYRIELEGKVGTNVPTPLQTMWLVRWTKVGAITGVYYSVEEALSLVMGGLRMKGVDISEFPEYQKHKNPSQKNSTF